MSPDDATIVCIAERHAAGFHACLDAVAQERRYLAQTEAPPFDRVQAFVAENVASMATQFVALDGERVIGWCDVFPDAQPTIRHRGSLGMGVIAEFRGRGLGGRLLVATLEDARRKGLTRVELEVRADNVPAIRLYEKVGFAHEGRKRQGMRFDGVYFETLTMARVWSD